MTTTARWRGASWRRSTSVAILAGVAAFCYAFVATGGFYRVTHERNYYDLLADGFLAGRTSLLVEPPPSLVAAFERRDYEAVGNQGALIDASLYKGRYYVYFGPAPAVMCAAWKLADRGSTCQSVPFMVLFAVGALVSMYFALHALERLMGIPWPIGRRLVLFCFGIAAIQLYLVGFPKVYHLSIGAGMAFVLASAAVFLDYLGGSRRPLLSLSVLGAFLSLAVSSRITMVFYAAVFAVALLSVELRRPGVSWGRTASRLVAFGVPLAATAIALLYYNWVRFGSPLEFGVTYSLNNASTRAIIDGGLLFGWDYIPKNLYWYFLYIPPVKAAFPFFALNDTEYYRFHNSSAFLTGPLTLLAAGAVVALIARTVRGAAATGVITLAAGTALTTAYILTFFGATKRYEYDFLPLWYLLAYVGLRHLRDRWPDAARWRIAARAAVAVLVIWSVGMGVLLGATSASLEFPPYLLSGHWKRRAEALLRPSWQVPVNLARTSGYPADFQRLATEAYRNERQFVMAWQGAIVTDAIPLKAGVYDLYLEHFSYSSTPDHVYAQFETSVEADSGSVIPLQASSRWESRPEGRIDRVSSFLLPNDGPVRVRIAYLNDATGSFADRNLYLTAIWLRRSDQYSGSVFAQPALTAFTGYPAEWNALAVSQAVRTGEFPLAWPGTVSTPAIDVPAGDYELAVEHRGTPLDGQYPMATVRVTTGVASGERTLVELRLTSSDQARTDRSAPFHVAAPTAARIGITFVNDESDGSEDRNLFIRRLYVMRLGNATASPAGP